MQYIESTIELLDYILANEERRHIVGGVLLSVSALFCGLAITTMTIDKETNHA